MQTWHEDRPVPTPVSPGTAFCGGCCKKVAAGIAITLLLLLPLTLYGPWINIKHTRRDNELLLELMKPSTDVRGILKEVSTLNSAEQSAVLNEPNAKPAIIKYFEKQAEAAIDEKKDKHDFAAALAFVGEAASYYPDSAELYLYRQDVRNRQAVYLGKSNPDPKK